MNRATFDFNGAMEAEVDAFYLRHPGLERTEVGVAFLARIFFSAGATEADGPALSTHTSADERNQKRMNTAPTTDPELWQTSPPPLDRPIWLRANIVITEDAMTSAEPFEDVARWDEDAQDWHDARGMSIRMYADAEMVILDWMECDERAKNCPTTETTIAARVYFYGAEEAGSWGWYALCDVAHAPTGIRISERNVGPFSTRAKAAEVLTALLADINLQEAAKAA